MGPRRAQALFGVSLRIVARRRFLGQHDLTVPMEDTFHTGPTLPAASTLPVVLNLAALVGR